MKHWILTAGVAAFLAGCSAGGGVLPEGAVEVTENQVNGYVGADGRVYNMRTFVVPPESPFYITVQAAGRQLAFEQAGRVAGSTAARYIQSRGCPGNLSRLSSRDVFDPSSNTWTVVIKC